jgi:predicted tellurium resistance membrane protein TerC
MVNIQKAVALALGVVFLLVGVLGFIPSLTPGDQLLGIFAVNAVHSIVHLLVGVLGIVAAYTGFSRPFNQVIGLVYLLIGVLGFIPGLTMDGMMLLGLVHINLADNLLHVVVGVAAAFVGFALAGSPKPAVSKQRI